MIVNKITKTKGKKLIEGTLPDIDTDFEGRYIGKVKNYMKDRFGHTQVCSVGSVTSLQLKGVIKDLDRQFENDFQTTNYITSIIQQKDLTLLDLFKRASSEPKLKQFIKNNSDIFHLLPKLLNQPKAKSIHPCAVIIFPDVMTASQWCPTRLQNDILVSEWDGYEMDDAGFLKEDILAIKQLDKFAKILELVKNNGKDVPDIYNLPIDQEVFRYFCNGWNGDVFQFGSSGMSSYVNQMKPQTMADLIAAVALYRPGPMENHFHEIYIKCKNEGRAPEYLWGTEKLTKDTHGLIIYQEQIMLICQELGGLNMKEADDIRRAMGKKKLDVLQAWRTRVEEGFLSKGCSQTEFDKIWDIMIEFAKYSFNKSHSVAYAKTGYIGQYLKVHFPLEYWTVALDYANDKDKLIYLSEIAQCKTVELLPSDINHSEIIMTSNQISKKIFWGIGSIKGIGDDTAEQIIVERKNGEYKSLTDFVIRHTFKGSKVKKQTYEALICSGAFDGLYGFKNDFQKRLSLIKRFRILKKQKIAKPEKDIFQKENILNEWWWLLIQKEKTGLAFIEYKKIAKNIGFETQFATTLETNSKQGLSIFRCFGGYVVDCKVTNGAKGKFARLTIEHNYKLFKVILWNKEYERFKEQIKDCEKSLILFTANMQYEAKYTKGNQFTLNQNSTLKILSK